jgi:hypothetical protein
VRYLITQGCQDLDEANSKLAEYRLQAISQTEFGSQYSALDRLPDPVLKQIESKQHEGDFKHWMRGIGLEEAYKNKADLPKALDILQDRTLRNTINALLIKQIAPQDIAQTTNIKFSCGISARHISVYSLLLWDIRRMAREDWRSYLAGSQEAEKHLLMVALSEDVETVKSLLELPSKSNVSDIMQHLLSQSFTKSKKYLKVDSPETNKEARAWMKMTLELASNYEKFRVGNIADFGKELQLEFDYISAEFETPDVNIMQEVKKKADPNERR